MTYYIENMQNRIPVYFYNFHNVYLNYTPRKIHNIIESSSRSSCSQEFYPKILEKARIYGEDDISVNYKQLKVLLYLSRRCEFKAAMPICNFPFFRLRKTICMLLDSLIRYLYRLKSISGRVIRNLTVTSANLYQIFPTNNIIHR